MLRPFEESDAESAFGWLGDSEVMRFTPAGPDVSMEGTRKRVQSYIEHQRIHGFSKWMVLDRSTGGAVGDCGLLSLNDSGKIDLGFRLPKRHWGTGLATEMAFAWAHAAFTDYGFSQLTAIAHPDNLASQNVLTKLGFVLVSVGHVFGMDAKSYALDADIFRKALAAAGRST